MKNVIFIAPPAAGKGTQSEILGKKYGYAHISTGDLLRNIDETSDLGKKVREVMNAGGLVSDELITELLRNALSEIKGLFILDGYPRNLTQAEILDNLFAELSITDYVAVYLDITEEMAMQRALGRITCPKCNAIYHRYNDSMKPAVEGVCDKCSASLISRDDDTEEAFKIRFQTYLENTKPLTDYFANKGKLRNVLVSEEKEETNERIVAVINGEVN